jgi:UDP-N-acetylmuramyl pentapeptide synthase
MMGEEALAVGMPRDRVFMIEETLEAIPLLEGVVRSGDFLLIKGSLGMGMSRIVTALSATAPGVSALGATARSAHSPVDQGRTA